MINVRYRKLGVNWNAADLRNSLYQPTKQNYLKDLHVLYISF